MSQGNGKVKIDKGVPMPTRSDSNDRPSKYPWKEMEIGDSFLFDKSVTKHSARTTPYQKSKQLGRKFMVRQTPNGFRCWRVA